MGQDLSMKKVMTKKVIWARCCGETLVRALIKLGDKAVEKNKLHKELKLKMNPGVLNEISEPGVHYVRKKIYLWF